MFGNSTFESQAENYRIWRTLKARCEKTGDYDTLALVKKVAVYSIEKLKVVIKYMGNFTLHDEVHIFNMLNIIDDLLPENILNELTVPDLMLILLSVFLHDVGMCPTEKERQILLGKENTTDIELKNEQKKYNDFKKSKILMAGESNAFYNDENNILSMYIRETHADRARRFINKDWKDMLQYMGVSFTEIVADICYSHCESIEYVRDNIESICSIGKTYACTQFVAVVLRLADIIDFDPSRAPLILMEHIDLSDKMAIREWEKHQEIRACCIRNNKIICAAKCKHPAIEYSIRKFCDLIDQELKDALYILLTMNSESYNDELTFYKSIRIPIRVDRYQIGPAKDDKGNFLYQYHESAFTLNKTQIIDLLMGTKLYNNSKVAIRELMQNSLDACLLMQRICNSRGKNSSYDPKISIRYFDSDGVTKLEIEDNGIGMNQEIIDNYYTNIGNSYYKSEEFYNLLASNNIEFSPISKFGIGILSCFMVADEMEVKTKRIDENDAISVTIEGYNSLFIIRHTDMDDYGTKTTLILRKDEPWKDMDKDEFVNCIKSILKTPPFPVYIYYKNEPEVKYETCWDNAEKDLQKLKKEWIITPNIKEINCDIDVPEYGFKGTASIAYITKNRKPVDYIETQVNNVSIQDKDYKISVVYSYDEYGIFRRADSLSIDDDNKVSIIGNYTTSMESYADISLHGITIPRNLFVDFNSKDRSRFIEFPLPTILVLDIYDKADLNLNSARTDIIADDKWKLFEKRIVLILCEKLREKIGNKKWNILQGIIIDKILDKDIKNVVRNMKIDD